MAHLQQFTECSEVSISFSASDIEHGIRSLKVLSATPGFLSVEALKAPAQLLAPCVAVLFNAFALVGCLLAALVGGECYHTKSGDTSVPSNYRGIAVGTVLSAELFAKLINTCFTERTETYGMRAVD